MRKKSSFIVVILLFSVFVMAFTPKTSTNIENVLALKEPVDRTQEFVPNAVYDDTYELGQCLLATR